MGDAGHGAAGADGQVVDAIAVLVDLALVAEAVGEGGVVQGCGALAVFDEDVLMSPGSAWAGIAGARSRVMRKLRSMTRRRRMMGWAITREGPLAGAAAPRGMVWAG
jgi:hypothetical protein